METLPLLMGRLCDGDGTAFAALYNRLYPLVRAELGQQVLAEADLALIAENTFLRLCRERDVYVSGADPTAWVLALAREEARAHTRRRSTERRRTTAATAGRLGQSGSDEKHDEAPQGAALFSIATSAHLDVTA